MSNTVKVATNSAYMTIGSVINRVFELFTYMFMVRYLSVEDVGLFSAFFAFFSICAIFVDAGMFHILKRECAKYPEKAHELFCNGFTLSIVIFIVIVPLAYLFFSKNIKDATLQSLFIYGAVSILVSSRFFSVKKLMEVLFIAKFRIIYPVLISILDRLLFFILLITVVRVSHSLNESISFVVITEIFGFIILMLIFSKLFGTIKLRFDIRLWWKLFKESHPLLLDGLAWVINMKFGVLLIGKFAGAEQAAIYNTATRIPIMFGFIAVAIVMPVSQIMSEKYEQKREVYFAIYKILSRYLMLIICPVSVLVNVEMREIIYMFFDERYFASIEISQILMLSQLFIFGYAGFASALIVAGKQNYVFYVTLLSTFVFLALGLILGKIYGGMGIAVASITSATVYLFFAPVFKHLRRLVSIHIRTFGKPLISALLMGIIIYFLDLNMFLSFPLGAIIYLIFYILFKGFKKEDFEFLYEVYPHENILKIKNLFDK